MKRFYVWKVERGWMGAAIEEERILRRLVLPRRLRKTVLSDLGAARGEDPSRSRAAAALRKALDGYLRTGRFRSPLDADPESGTPFQRKVWKETANIPRGEVRTYGWLARRAGGKGAARAVGQAMGANPLPIIVP